MRGPLFLLVVLLLSMTGAACTAAEAEDRALPFYAERSFSPVWVPVTHSTTTHVVSDTPFLDQDGKMFTPASMAGRVHVVSFVFTRCASICPSKPT